MKKTLLFILIFPILIFGQNLIYNGDFEDYTSLPDDKGQLMNCVGWNNINLQTGWFFEDKPMYASPDYFHEESNVSTTVGLPINSFAYIEPYSGNAIVGLGTYAGGEPPPPIDFGDLFDDFREYISSELITELVVGETYSLSFYLSNGEANWYAGASCNHFGIHFSEYPLYQFGNEPINVSPTLEIEGEVWSTNWEQYVFTFEADQPYKFISIGNFYNDESTSSTMIAEEGYSLPWSYYFIDKIELVNHSNSNINDDNHINKTRLKTIDILGRETINQGFQLHIYNDGSIEKKYILK